MENHQTEVAIRLDDLKWIVEAIWHYREDFEEFDSVETQRLTRLANAAATKPPNYWKLMLWHHGTNKIACIKAIRAITGFGLKEAKQLSETPTYNRPTLVAIYHTAETARAACTHLLSSGAEALVEAGTGAPPLPPLS